MVIYKSVRQPWNGPFPHGSQKEPTLPTPQSWTLSLQNCERVNFFKPLSLRYLL